MGIRKTVPDFCYNIIYHYVVFLNFVSKNVVFQHIKLKFDDEKTAESWKV